MYRSEGDMNDVAFTGLAIGLFQKYHKLYSLLSLQNLHKHCF